MLQDSELLQGNSRLQRTPATVQEAQRHQLTLCSPFRSYRDLWETPFLDGLSERVGPAPFRGVRLPLTTNQLSFGKQSILHMQGTCPIPPSHHRVKRVEMKSLTYFVSEFFFWRTLMYTFLRRQLLKLNQASWTSLKSSCCNLKYDSSVHQNRRDMVAASENRTATVPWDRTGFPHQNSLFGYLIQLQVADQLLRQHLWNLLLQDLLCFSIGRAVESSSIKATSWAVVWA